MKGSSGFGVNPFPVDLLELEVLWGWGVARQIAPLIFPVLLVQRLFAPTLSLFPDGLSLGMSGEVPGRSFPFPFPSCARLCLPPLHLSVSPSSLPRPCLFFRLYLACLLLVV